MYAEYKYETLNLYEIMSMYNTNKSMLVLKYNALMNLNALEFIKIMSNENILYEIHTFLHDFQFKFHSVMVDRNSYINVDQGIIQWIPDNYHIHKIDNICTICSEKNCIWCLGSRDACYISTRDSKEKYMLYIYRDIAMLWSGKLKNVIDFIHNHCKLSLRK